VTPPLQDSAEELIALFQGLGAVGTVNAIGTTTTAGVTLPDPTVAAVNTASLGGATPFTLPPALAGKKLRALLTQDATGSRTPTYTTAAGTSDTIVASGTVTLTTTGGAQDLVEFECLVAGQWVKTAKLHLA